MSPGGAPTALDLSTEADRGLLRQAIKHGPRRWRGLSDARKDEFADMLHQAAQASRELLKAEDLELRLKAAKSVESCVSTAVQMEAQNQKDEHADRHYQRIDSDKPTELVKFDGMRIIIEG